MLISEIPPSISDLIARAQHKGQNDNVAPLQVTEPAEKQVETFGLMKGVVFSPGEKPSWLNKEEPVKTK